MNILCEEKIRLLVELAEKRKSTDLRVYFGETGDRYRHLGEFHGGIYDCHHVSPWTRSGGCPNASVMIVGQDWSSAEHLEKDPPNPHMAVCGFDPNFLTNRNLNRLLARHLKTTRSACYLTNLFPFIKSGQANGFIPMGHLVRCATDFLVPQIEIVGPRAVICLGLRTINALGRAIGLSGARQLADAIAASPRLIDGTKIFAVAHTGSLGTKNREPEQVERDWQRIARLAEA